MSALATLWLIVRFPEGRGIGRAASTIGVQRTFGDDDHGGGPNGEARRPSQSAVKSPQTGYNVRIVAMVGRKLNRRVSIEADRAKTIGRSDLPVNCLWDGVHQRRKYRDSANLSSNFLAICLDGLQQYRDHSFARSATVFIGLRSYCPSFKACLQLLRIVGVMGLRQKFTKDKTNRRSQDFKL